MDTNYTDDTETRQTIDGLMIQLRAGDRTAVDRIVAAFNNRKVDRRGAGYQIKGWEIVEL